MTGKVSLLTRVDRIGDLRAIEAIARNGSLTAAAQELGISLTAISKRLGRIEEAIGARLAQRSTRHLNLTEEGERFLEICRTVLDAIDAAEDMDMRRPQGLVRVSAAVAFSQRQIAPRLGDFIEAFPGVSVQVLSNNQLIDLVKHKVDVAFRQAPLDNSSYITRTIGPDAEFLCASPAYVERFGMPGHPQDLRSHRCMTTGDPAPRSWTLYRGDETFVAPLTSFIGATDGEVPHVAALQGHGIAMKSSWDVIDDIREGRLVRILPDWWGRPRTLRVVYPVRSHQPRRIQAFVRFMEGELRAAAAAAEHLGIFMTTTG